MIGQRDTEEYVPRSIGDSRPPAPKPPRVDVEVAAQTNPGKLRSNNEDHFLVTRVERRLDTLVTNLPSSCLPNHAAEIGYGYLVADGMGGAVAGEVASRTAITTFLHILHEAPAWIMNFQGDMGNRVMQRMADRFRQVDAELSKYSQSQPGLSGMGTTLTLASTAGEELLVTHVGDSRAYVYRDGALRCITKDQTLATELADAGEIPREEVNTNRYRHVLTQAIGRKGGEVDVQVERMRLADHDQLLLCSDGLTEMVSEAEIAATLKTSATAEVAANSLIALALEHGGKDNVTVVLARYRITPG